MLPRFSLKDVTFSAILAGFVAVLVGYTSSAAIIFQAAEAAGASPLQIGGWLTMLGLGMGLTSIGLSLSVSHANRHRVVDTRRGAAGYQPAGHLDE